MLKQFFLVLLFISMVLFAQGCVAVAVGAGAGTIAYIRGDLETVESEKLEVVYKAVVKAMDELELNITKKTKDAMSAVVVARDAQNTKITIRLLATTEDITRLSVRAGLFGNERKSRLVYQQIRDNL